MDQALRTDDDDDDDDDEPTQSYTHSEIRLMRDAAAPRNIVVRLEDFLHFGEAGTPAGMLGSENAATFALAGWCGEGVPAAPAAESSEVSAPQLVDVPVPRSSGSSSARWPQARPEQVAAPALVDDEMPTAKLGVVEVPGDAPSDPQPSAALDDSDTELEHLEAALRRRKLRWLVLAIPALVFPLMFLLLRGDKQGDDKEAAVAEAPGSQTPTEAAEARASTSGEPEPARSTDLVPPPVSPKAPEAKTNNERPKNTKAKSHRQRKPWATPACERARRAAKAAAGKKGDWDQVIKHTKNSSCWQNKTEHKLLRMNALFERGRLKECARLGRGARDEDVKELLRTCEIASTSK